MKKILFLLITFMSLFQTGQARNKLLVTININDCVNCINALSALKAIDTNFISFTFVFQAKYQADAQSIIDNYMLEYFHPEYIWSDAVYDQYIIGAGISSVSFLNSAGNRAMSTPLKNTTNNTFLTCCNQKAAKDNTRQFADRISATTSRIRTIDGNFYLLDNVNNTINIIDGVSLKSVASLGVSDSLWQQAYTLKFKEKAPEEIAKSRRYLQELSIRKYKEIKDCAVDNKGYVYTIVEFLHFSIFGQDTLGRKFYTLNKYEPDGNFKDMYLINDLMPIDMETFNLDSMKADKRNSFLPYSFHVNNDTLMMGALCRHQEKKYFLVYYTLEGNTATFRKYYEEYLPGAYGQYGYNYTDPIFDREGKYVCLGLEDKIFSLQSQGNISLDLFQVVQFEQSIYSFKKMIRAIESDSNYLYILYWNSLEKRNYYARFSFRDNAIVENTPIVSVDQDAPICLLDDFDPAYIYLVGENGTLRHYRMSNP